MADAVSELLPKSAPWLINSRDVKLPAKAQVLGSGRFSEVCAGSWFSCPAAVKKFHPAVFRTVAGATVGGGGSRSKKQQRRHAEHLARFHGHMAVLSTLHHPHIVDFYGVCALPSHEVPVLVSEQLFRTLACRLYDRSCPEPAVRDCIGVALQITSGLQYLHDRSEPIVHGNLSCDNVLLTVAGVCKLSDVGLARVLTEQQQNSLNSVYLPLSMPVSEQFTCSVDVYSLGVILLHMLAARKPLDPIQPDEPISMSEDPSTVALRDQLSCAKVRFGPYMDELLKLGLQEPYEIVEFILQPRRPSLAKVHKRLMTRTATPADAHATTALTVSAEQLVSEMRALRTTVSEMQTHTDDSGYMLQELVECQRQETMEGVQLGRSTLDAVRTIHQNLMMTLPQSFQVIHALLTDVHGVTHAIMAQVAAREQLMSQQSFLSGAHPPLSTASGADRSFESLSFDGSFDDSAYQFERSGYPQASSPQFSENGAVERHRQRSQQSGLESLPEHPASVPDYGDGGSGLSASPEGYMHSPDPVEVANGVASAEGDLPLSVPEDGYDNRMADESVDPDDDWPTKIGAEAPEEEESDTMLPPMEPASLSGVEDVPPQQVSAVSQDQEQHGGSRSAGEEKEHPLRDVCTDNDWAETDAGHILDATPQQEQVSMAATFSPSADDVTALCTVPAEQESVPAPIPQGSVNEENTSSEAWQETSPGNNTEASTGGDGPTLGKDSTAPCPQCGFMGTVPKGSIESSPMTEASGTHATTAATGSLVVEGADGAEDRLEQLCEYVHRQQVLQTAEIRELLESRTLALQQLHAEHQRQLEQLKDTLSNSGDKDEPDSPPVPAVAAMQSSGEATAIPSASQSPRVLGGEAAVHQLPTDVDAELDDGSDDSDFVPDGRLANSIGVLANSMVYLFRGIANTLQGT